MPKKYTFLVPIFSFPQKIWHIPPDVASYLFNYITNNEHCL